MTTRILHIILAVVAAIVVSSGQGME